MFNVVLVIGSIVLIICLAIRKKRSGEGLTAKGKTVLSSCILIICAVLICASISVVRPFGSFANKADRIEIRNGNTGQLYVLENEKARALADELKDTDTKVSGLLLSMGYSYTIDFIKGSRSKTIVVKSANIMTKGIVKYQTDTDMVELILTMINE
jgi:hypothetical protein